MKAQYPDTVLFYRIGDFYEMFLDDAELGSRVMGIALTTRSRDNEAKVPMCGVPYHALNGYLAKMIRAGYRVTLCEQVEDPKAAKGADGRRRRPARRRRHGAHLLGLRASVR